MLSIDVAQDENDGIADFLEIAALNYNFDDAAHQDVLNLLRDVITEFSPSMMSKVAAITLELVANNSTDWRDFTTKETLVEFFSLKFIEQMMVLAECANREGHMQDTDFAIDFINFLRFQFEVCYAD